MDSSCKEKIRWIGFFQNPFKKKTGLKCMDLPLNRKRHEENLKIENADDGISLKYL